jgi:hypothetical protein
MTINAGGGFSPWNQMSQAKANVMSARGMETSSPVPAIYS